MLSQRGSEEARGMSSADLPLGGLLDGGFAACESGWRDLIRNEDVAIQFTNCPVNCLLK